jgi:hypothetical protein
MEIKDGRLVCLRRRLPSNQRNAIGGRDLDFLDAIEASFRGWSTGRIGEVHKSAVAEIGDHTNHRVDRKNPKDNFHNSSSLTEAIARTHDHKP